MKHFDIQLDEEYAEKLADIQQQTNQDLSEVVQRAIDFYHKQLQPIRKNPLEIMKQSGFVGCVQAEPDLSVNYKSILRVNTLDNSRIDKKFPC